MNFKTRKKTRRLERKVARRLQRKTHAVIAKFAYDPRQHNLSFQLHRDNEK